ncbi:MAG: type II secretion system F family protein [Gammaproteobacteria bacterium]|nr:MAG: type II secretion system F family protein [Gammaproteobacteria bacterium]
MPVFSYKAASMDGEVFNGTLDAGSREQVVAKLQSLGQIPIQVDETVQPGGSQSPGASFSSSFRRSSARRITDQHISNATRELSILLRAGLPLDRALSILGSLSESENMKQLLLEVQEQVKGGATLTDAMQAQEGVFSRFYLNLLRAGEAGGALEVVLERLAEHMEQSLKVRDNLHSALIYPAVLIFVAVVSIFILLGYVVPQFTELFEGAGQVLPLPTRITIATGEFLQHYGWILLLLTAAAAWLLRYQLTQPRSRYQWHARFLRLPLAGSIITKIEVTRFARTLGMLLHNGVPLLKALSIVKDTVDNRVIADGLERVASSLKEGQSLAAPLAEMAHFPAFAVHMIRVGEESGRLEEILQQVAQVYERETETTIKRALALLEPVLILVLGVVIAGVIISILMAILSINQLAF